MEQFRLLNDPGHTLIFGRSNSGKTHLAKYLISCYDPDKIYVFTVPQSNKDWVNYNPKNSLDDHYDQMISEASKLNKCIVVFDDCNNSPIYNIKYSQKIKDLYTTGRKSNLKIIHMVHEVTGVGKTIRSNATFIFIMSNFRSKDDVMALSDEFLGPNNYQNLKTTIDEAFNKTKFNAVYIDKDNPKNLGVMLADKDLTPPRCLNVVQLRPRLQTLQPNKQTQQLQSITQQTQSVQNNPVFIQPTQQPINEYEVPASYPADSPINQGSIPLWNNVTPNVSFAFGNKSAHNLHDQSYNNFNVTPKISQTTEIQQQIHQQNIIRLEQKQELQKEERKYEILNLMALPALNVHQRNRVILLLNEFVQPKLDGKPVCFKVNEAHYLKAKKMFLNMLQKRQPDLYKQSAYLLNHNNFSPGKTTVATAAQWYQDPSTSSRLQIAYEALNNTAPSYMNQLEGVVSSTVTRLLK